MADVLDSHPTRGSQPGSGRVAVAALVVLAVVAGLLLLRHPGRTPAALPLPLPSTGAGPSHSPTTGPSPTPVSLELKTEVTVAHIRLKGASVQRLLALVGNALADADLRSSYLQVADKPFGLAGVPVRDGVQVAFDRLLPPPGQAAFRRALSTKLPDTQWSLGTEPGTTVTITVPVRPQSRCVTGDYEEPLHLLAADLRSIGDVFPFYSPVAADDAVRLTYTGPARSGAQLRAVAAAVAHSCGVPATGATFTRPPDPEPFPPPPGETAGR